MEAEPLEIEAYDAGDSPRYLPDEETIRRECEAIRAGWDAATELSRRCWRNGSPDYGKVRRVEVA